MSRRIPICYNTPATPRFLRFCPNAKWRTLLQVQGTSRVELVSWAKSSTPFRGWMREHTYSAALPFTSLQNASYVDARGRSAETQAKKRGRQVQLQICMCKLDYPKPFQWSLPPGEGGGLDMTMISSLRSCSTAWIIASTMKCKVEIASWDEIANRRMKWWRATLLWGARRTAWGQECWSSQINCPISCSSFEMPLCLLAMPNLTRSRPPLSTA